MEEYVPPAARQGGGHVRWRRHGCGHGCSQAREEEARRGRRVLGGTEAAARALRRARGRRRQPGGASAFFSRVVARPGEEVRVFIGAEL